MKILLSLLFIGGLLSAQTPPSVEDLTTQIDALVEEQSATEPGAAIAVLRDGELIYERAFGLANATYNIPNSNTTIFDAMSLAKQFTGFGISMLVEKGDLDLADDIREYLPEVPDFGTPITIYHLLHHTSGLRDFAHLLYMGGYQGEYSKDAILRLVTRQETLNFPPGSEMTYSNTGYVLLALIIERVSGQSFPDWMEEHIFAPLEMNNSSFRRSSEQIVPQLAQGYFHNGEAMRAPINELTAHGSSSLLTTAGDLIKWMQNFETHNLGGTAVFERFTQGGELNNGESVNYAAGINKMRVMGMPALEHTGGGVGFRSIVVYFPEQRLGIAMVANAAWIHPEEWGGKIIRLARGEAASPPRPAVITETVEIAPDVIVRYVGTYFFPPQQQNVVIFAEEGKLFLQPDNNPAFEMTPTGANTFTLVEPGLILDYIFDEAGHVIHIKVERLGDDPTFMTPVEVSPDYAPTAEELKGFSGRFHSSELATELEVVAADDHLIVHSFRHPSARLVPGKEKDQFQDETGLLDQVSFLRDPSSGIIGFHAAVGDRVRNVLFEKTD